MYPIKAISSITHQPSFENADLYKYLQPLTEDSIIQAPDYKKYIQPAALRRLSPILRMAITAARTCQNQIEQAFDAISVGTALGCLADTEKFLITINTVSGDVLSPTAFIQSTHNTIGGQISLDLQNLGYNMTHTQNHLSFEVALLDAMLCCDEGCTNVLVGAADEVIPFLKKLQGEIIPARQLSSGVSFFVLSKKVESFKGVSFEACVISELSHVRQACEDFLSAKNLKLYDIDLVFLSDEMECAHFDEAKSYLPYTGFYYTASAFAAHLAEDFLRNNQKKRALIVNTLCPGKIGLTLLFNHGASN